MKTYFVLLCLIWCPAWGYSADLGFAQAMADEGDCYRAISEVLGYEYQVEVNARSLAIKVPCLADQQDWAGFEQALPYFLTFKEIPLPIRHSVIRTAFKHFSDTAQPVKAQHLASQLQLEQPPYPTSGTVPNLQDPESVQLASAILPGSGLWMAGKTTSGFISLSLNASFIYGTWWALQHKAPAMAALLMFFELSWYEGGKKAAVEAVERSNHELVKKEQQVWLLHFEGKF